MFSETETQRVRTLVIDMARADPRVLAGAEVGSRALGGGDRWSDLDLTFALREDVDLGALADEWAQTLRTNEGVALLFDLPVPPTLYRVFLWPGALQVDLSWTTRAIPQRGEKFRMLFGDAVERMPRSRPDARQSFGLAVHHALRARICIERGRPWAAAWCIEGLRNETLTLACIARGLPERFARSHDVLPGELLDRTRPTLVRGLERDELLRALAAAIDLLRDECGELVRAASPTLDADLRTLASGDLA